MANDTFTNSQLERGRFGERLVQNIAMTRYSGVSLAFAPEWMDRGCGIDLIKVFDPRFPGTTPTSYASTHTYQVKTLEQLDKYPTAPMEILVENPITKETRVGSILNTKATFISFVVPHKDQGTADVLTIKREKLWGLIYDRMPSDGTPAVYSDNITKVSTSIDPKYISINANWGAGKFTNSHNALLKKDVLFANSSVHQVEY